MRLLSWTAHRRDTKGELSCLLLQLPPVPPQMEPRVRSCTETTRRDRPPQTVLPSAARTAPSPSVIPSSRAPPPPTEPPLHLLPLFFLCLLFTPTAPTPPLPNPNSGRWQRSPRLRTNTKGAAVTRPKAPGPGRPSPTGRPYTDPCTTPPRSSPATTTALWARCTAAQDWP